MSLLKPTEGFKMLPFDEYDRRRKYPRDLPVAFLPTNLTKRTPCGHQGHSHKCFEDDENPCLVCAGNIRRLGGDDVFMCPFEDNRDQNTIDFKESIDLKFITASERYFDIRQQAKKM